MDFIDLKTQQNRIKEKIETRIQTVLTHGQYIMGPEIRELEERLSEFIGVKHAVGCASGTDALLLALMAYQVGPGDAVLTSPFTFFATAEVISLLGATPVFVDIDPNTFNLDPIKLDLARQALIRYDQSIHPLPQFLSPNSELRTPNLVPKGIIAVDLFGLTADYDPIHAVAQKNDLFVIEDAAQSFGAEYRGKKACALSEMTCTSFFPAKPLGAYGDGGMCFTTDDRLSEILYSLRVHGQGGNKYENVRLGLNGRLDTLQAAILLAKFEVFAEEIALRQEVAQRYTRLLSGLGLDLPSVPMGYRSVWAQYSVMASDSKKRKTILEQLTVAGVPTAIYYPTPLHLQKAFAFLGYRQGDFPVSEDCAKRIFSLPMHPYLKAEDQERIARIIR